MFTFDNTYSRLPERCFARVAPTRVSAPRWLALNGPLAEVLTGDAAALETREALEVFAGNAIPVGAEPMALAYAGHQFGSFVRQLGDGRALLLGEVVGTDGKRRDVQLKGSGRTPFSRGGDGRAALGPVLREYLVSEAMAALGIPTTRALAAVATGDRVVREELLPGAVLTRVAASHLRVGTFQYFAARGDAEALRALTGYALSRHYPAAQGTGNDALALLRSVSEAQAELVARWLGVGFVHGVMNTDNTSISGETIDYGPCAFLDAHDPGTVFSSIDHGGRYAFGNQPRVAQWNVARLAEALLGLISEDEGEAVRLATEVVESFATRFEEAHLAVMRRKLGLLRADDGDGQHVEELLSHLAAHRVDHTRFFRRLSSALEAANDAALVTEFGLGDGAFPRWLGTWRARLATEGRPMEEHARAMRAANPAIIPRNHRVEEALAAALEDDLGPFRTLHAALSRPYEEQPQYAWLEEPPGEEQRGYRTFCGT